MFLVSIYEANTSQCILQSSRLLWSVTLATQRCITFIYAVECDFNCVKVSYVFRLHLFNDLRICVYNYLMIYYICFTLLP